MNFMSRPIVLLTFQNHCGRRIIFSRKMLKGNHHSIVASLQVAFSCFLAPAPLFTKSVSGASATSHVMNQIKNKKTALSPGSMNVVNL